MSEYLVVIEHEGESWGAYCPDRCTSTLFAWPGILSRSRPQ